MELKDKTELIDYKSLLSRYMQVVTNTEGIHYIDECSPIKCSYPNPVFTSKEIDELYRLFDDFCSP